MFGDDLANWTEMWITIPYSVSGPPLEGISHVRHRFEFHLQGMDIVRDDGLEIEWKTIQGNRVGREKEAFVFAAVCALVDCFAVFAAVAVVGACCAYAFDAMSSADYAAELQLSHSVRPCLIIMQNRFAGCDVVGLETVWALVEGVVLVIAGAVIAIALANSAQTLAVAVRAQQQARAEEVEAAAAARAQLQTYPKPFVLRVTRGSKRRLAAFWAASGAILPGRRLGIPDMAKSGRICQLYLDNRCHLGADCLQVHEFTASVDESGSGSNPM